MKREYIYIRNSSIAYGVVGQSLLTKLMPLCPAYAVHKYKNFNFRTFNTYFIKAAKNNLIGYDQNARLSYYNHLKASNWDASKITIACERHLKLLEFQ